MECVVMGKKEQLKISIIEKIIAGKLQQKKALDYLNVSERTLRRWILSYKQKGIRSFVHVLSSRNFKDPRKFIFLIAGMIFTNCFFLTTFLPQSLCEKMGAVCFFNI